MPEAERDARRVARWLERQNPIPATLNVRVMRRQANGSGVPTSARIVTALEELAALQWVRPAAPNNAGTGGRSRNDWLVNPMRKSGRHGLA